MSENLTTRFFLLELGCFFVGSENFWCSLYHLVASVQNAHQGEADVCHAMVLDTFDKENDVLIFKNTYDDPEGGQPKHFQIKRTDPNAPEELFFVHIEIQDMDKLPDKIPLNRLRPLRTRH